MKEFMLIFIGKNYVELGLSPEEMQGRMGKWMGWSAKMEKQGILKEGHALTPDAKRITGPTRTITDGPFAESKEMVGGYYVVTVDSFEAAVQVAQDFPDYDLGNTVEVREVMVFER